MKRTYTIHSAAGGTALVTDGEWTWLVMAGRDFRPNARGTDYVLTAAGRARLERAPGCARDDIGDECRCEGCAEAAVARAEWRGEDGR
jgi:hypothetical protein